MKLKKPQLTLAIVLALGGGAIAVDKLVIGYSDPAGAAAAAPAASTTALAPAPAARPASAAPAPSRSASTQPASLASRLNTLSKSIAVPADLPDPFAPPQAWTAKPEVPAPVSKPVLSAPDDLPTPSNLRVSMTMLPKEGKSEIPVAVINGTPYRQGESVEGFTIEAVGTDRVTLRKGDKTVDLVIPRPSAERRRP